MINLSNKPLLNTKVTVTFTFDVEHWNPLNKNSLNKWVKTVADSATQMSASINQDKDMDLGIIDANLDFGKTIKIPKYLKPKHRPMSAEHKAKIAAHTKARWAKLKGANH